MRFPVKNSHSHKFRLIFEKQFDLHRANEAGEFHFGTLFSGIDAGS